MFITKPEFKSAIIPEILERLTNKDDAVLDTIIKESIDEMKGFLNVVNYDLTAFDETGTDRNNVLLKHLKRICAYELYKRKDHLVDTDTQNAYDETMSWLREVATGKASVFGLDTIDDTNSDGSTSNYIEFGSNPKYQSGF